MSVAASAPGKLVLLGEYAVLEGAPALALASAERARVELAPPGQGPARLYCHPGCPEGIAWVWDDAGRAHWLEPVPDGLDLRWLQAMLAALRERGHWPGAAQSLTTDTTYFHRPDGGKLGLGASAALGVALAAAATAARTGQGDQVPALEELIDLHTTAQGGHGSGVDIATALLGGTVAFRRDGDGVRAERVDAPPDALFVAVVTGESVSTPAYLQRLDQWRRAAPRTSATIMRGLCDGAEAGLRALTRPADLVEAVAAYARRLAELEAAADLEIFGGAHRRIGALAERAGVAYKPSGAGGDCGIGVGLDPDRMAWFRSAAASAGFVTLEPAPHGRGCAVAINPTSETIAP